MTLALEDFMESEVGLAIAATAVVLSPRVRDYLRRGAVYLLAGGIRAGDALSGAVQGMAQEAQHISADGAAAAQQTVREARTTARAGRAGQEKKES
jgi:hypothetical protein